MSPVEEKKKKRFIPSREEWKLAGIRYSLKAIKVVIPVVIMFSILRKVSIPFWIAMWFLITTWCTIENIVNYIGKKILPKSLRNL